MSPSTKLEGVVSESKPDKMKERIENAEKKVKKEVKQEKDTVTKVKDFIFPKGVYSGEMKNGKRHGYGIMRWNEGDVDECVWCENLKHELVVQTFQSGVVECTTVHYKDGILPNSLGISKLPPAFYPMVRSIIKFGDRNSMVILANGWTLDLQVNNKGSFEGKGFVKNKDGKVMFEGEWKDDELQFGSPLYFIFWAAWFVRYPLWNMIVLSSILFSMYSLLSGAHNRLSHMKVSNSTLFSDGQPGAQYSGQLSYFRRHGQGVMIYENDSTYNGSWSQGVMSGPGTLTFSLDCECDQRGDVLSGDWVDNELRHGTYSYFSGEVYTGDLANFERHGAGAMRYVDGSVYEGQFNHDFREGRGTLLETDGWACEGQWYDDEQHGPGECRFRDEDETFPGVWLEGEVVSGGKPTTPVLQAPKSEPNKPTKLKSAALMMRDLFVSFLDVLLDMLSKRHMISVVNIVNLILWPLLAGFFIAIAFRMYV